MSTNNFFNPELRGPSVQKHYATEARSMSAAKAQKYRGNYDSFSGKSTYATILSRESERKRFLNQTHEYKPSDFRSGGDYSPMNGTLETSFGAMSKSPGRRSTTDQMYGSTQYTKPPAYKHREKNELYERIIEKILQKENVGPSRPSHSAQHQRANSSFSGSFQNKSQRSRSNSPKHSILSTSSRICCNNQSFC